MSLFLSPLFLFLFWSAIGFLVGGVPSNFGISARLGASPYFVVEADEYDTAFFDKRSKFVHYRPRTLIINNIEYDHADIFADVDAIIWQFHQLLRTVPRSGLIVANAVDANIERLLARGVWTPLTRFSARDRRAQWWGNYDSVGEQARFSVAKDGAAVGSATFPLFGVHNLENALAAIAAAAHVGVAPAIALEALTQFKGVKRRLELRGTFGGIALYEDFAHHPTAIATTPGLLTDAERRWLNAYHQRVRDTVRYVYEELHQCKYCGHRWSTTSTQEEKAEDREEAPAIVAGLAVTEERTGGAAAPLAEKLLPLEGAPAMASEAGENV